MVYYFNVNNEGLISANSLGDGYSINLKWNQAFPSNKTNKIAYHIFMATEEDNVFTEGPKFVSVDGTLTTDILDLVPGQLYHFAIRAVEYNATVFDVSELPQVFNGLSIYPESILTADITRTSLVIPILDTESFPDHGVVQIGYELINYLAIDPVNHDLVLTNIAQRGFFHTNARFHTTDGYDGYHTIFPPVVRFSLGREEQNTRVFPCQNRFEFPNYQFTMVDGYHQVVKDLLTTDLSGSDAFNQDFPTYDYAGWHRTSPLDILTGVCVGSYIGGEMYCADGYSGVGRVVRGLSLQDQNNQRQEVLLNVDGEPVVLIKRMTTGITCACYTPEREYGDERCPICYGGAKFVLGYQQFFNPRRSDGRILVRFSPADDDLIMNEAGWESSLIADCWTLTVPTIKDRDILVRFDEDGNEEFRYEVLSVNRNKTINSLEGGQKFRVQRIRKYDPAYQITVFRNTQFIPRTISTTSGFTTGIPAHTHIITANENDPSTWAQTTQVSQGHNHQVIIKNGVPTVLEILGHRHEIVI